jgi:hypothetical protein
MNIIDPKWIKAEHERRVAALVVMLQAFELFSKGQRTPATNATATLGDIEARDRAHARISYRRNAAICGRLRDC